MVTVVAVQWLFPKICYINLILLGFWTELTQKLTHGVQQEGEFEEYVG